MDLEFLVDSALKPNEFERLSRYAQDLLRFNRAANLVSRRDPERQIRSLLRECVGVGRWLRGQELASGPWMDLGSGAGFPGLVLGILEPQQDVVLVERRRGRCDFLRREVGSLGLDRMCVEEGDARKLGAERPGSFALVSLKAVAPPGEALGLAEPFLAPRGRVLLFQRPDWIPADRAAASSWMVTGAWRGEGDLEDQAAFLLERAAR